MAKTIFIVACVLLSSAFQVSEGRQLRLREKQLLTVMSAYKAVDSDQPLVPEAPAQVVNAAQPPPPPPPPPSGHVDNFRPTNPGHSPGAGHSLQLQTSSAHLVKKDASTTHDHDNNSHKTATDDGVVAEAPSPNPNATRPPPPTRRADDFKPTTPGHSPGAGHSIKT